MVSDLERYDRADWTLWGEIDDCIDYWRTVYQKYWGIGSDASPAGMECDVWERAKQNDEAAPNFLKVALALSIGTLPTYTPDDSGRLTKHLRDLLGSMARTSQIRDRLSFDIATDAYLKLRGSSERVAELLELVLDRRLNERTASFLERAGRLYVYGFDPEALVMCRAGLDAALQEVMTDARMTDTGFQKRVDKFDRPLEFSLEDRINGARSLKLLSYLQMQVAHKLRRAGNNAVHVAPVFLEDGIGNALQAIRTTTDLIDSIFGGSQ